MREWDRQHRSKRSATDAMVALNPKVPAELRDQARAEALAEGVTFQDWVTDALVAELVRRRTLGV